MQLQHLGSPNCDHMILPTYQALLHPSQLGSNHTDVLTGKHLIYVRRQSTPIVHLLVMIGPTSSSNTQCRSEILLLPVIQYKLTELHLYLMKVLFKRYTFNLVHLYYP